MGALGFWPDGSAPATDAPVFDITTMELSSTIEGSLIRYSVNTNAEREKCDTIGADFRAAHPVLYVYSIGMDTVPYTSRRNGNSYDGYLYGGDTEYALSVTFFMGFLPGCSIFIKNDGTFMEVVAPSVSPIVFDTRMQHGMMKHKLGTMWILILANGLILIVALPSLMKMQKIGISMHSKIMSSQKTVTTFTLA